MMVADEQVGKLAQTAEEAADEMAEAVEETAEELFESEVIELEINEDDILYYITDQDDNEIGFAIMEDGQEVEYYYETDEDYHIVEVLEDVYDDVEDADSDVDGDDDDEELLIEMEIDDDDILYYLVDEDDNEIGFAIMEDGREVEYYYVDEEIDVAAEEAATDAPADAPAPAAEPASAQASDAAAAKGADDATPLFTAEEISEFKDDMVGLLKDGASVARELKSTYEEFSDVLDFLPIKKKHR